VAGVPLPYANLQHHEGAQADGRQSSKMFYCTSGNSSEHVPKLNLSRHECAKAYGGGVSLRILQFCFIKRNKKRLKKNLRATLKKKVAIVSTDKWSKVKKMMMLKQFF